MFNPFVCDRVLEIKPERHLKLARIFGVANYAEAGCAQHCARRRKIGAVESVERFRAKLKFDVFRKSEIALQ